MFDKKCFWFYLCIKLGRLYTYYETKLMYNLTDLKPTGNIKETFYETKI